jgi:hypothetical protein
MTTGLERLAAEAVALAGGEHPCNIIGHKWIFAGGANCGCADGSCSVPVHQCDRCGDYDYGENEEAKSVRAECARDFAEAPGEQP